MTDRPDVRHRRSLAGRGHRGGDAARRGVRRPDRPDRRRAAGRPTNGLRCRRSTCAASSRSRTPSCARPSGTPSRRSTRGSARAPSSSTCASARWCSPAASASRSTGCCGHREPQPRASTRRAPTSPACSISATPTMPMRIREAVGRRRAGRLRRHGLHRRRGRGVAAHARQRRHGRRGLRDHPVPGPGPRHRPGARGHASRPRGEDAVQRGGGQLRRRRPARSGGDQRRPAHRGRRRDRRRRHRARGGAHGRHRPGPGRRHPGRADARDRRCAGSSRRATSRGTSIRCSVPSASSTSTTRSRWARRPRGTCSGPRAVFDDPHWFWSDQYDVPDADGGVRPTWDRMVVRGSLEERSFCAFLLDGDGVAALHASAWIGKRDVRRSFGLIAAQVAPDPTALADPDVDLRTLVPVMHDASGPGARPPHLRSRSATPHP